MNWSQIQTSARQKSKARDLETEISKLQQESGYPYVVNIDTANRANQLMVRLS